MKDWHTKTTEMQKDLGFVIMRSQKPLIYMGKPFLPFTLGTYMLVGFYYFITQKPIPFHHEVFLVLGSEELLSVAGPIAGVNLIS